jgi:hypothetical protein
MYAEKLAVSGDRAICIAPALESVGASWLPQSTDIPAVFNQIFLTRKQFALSLFVIY